MKGQRARDKDKRGRRAHRIFQRDGHNLEVGPPSRWAPPKNQKLLEFGPLFFGWAHLFCFVHFTLYFINFLLRLGRDTGSFVPLCAALVPSSNPFIYLVHIAAVEFIAGDAVAPQARTFEFLNDITYKSALGRTIRRY